MGMFDDLRCDYPLPVPGATGHGFQTKSLDCEGDSYRITADGHLEMAEHDGTGKVARWNPTPFSGDVSFYDTADNGQWVEFTATFVAGELQGIVQGESWM